MYVFGIITDFQYFCKRFKSMSMSQAIIKKKERRVIIIQGYSAHPTNPVECCADANPKTMLPNDT